MKLLGFITGMILIGGIGAWYMQEKAPLPGSPLNEETTPPGTELSPPPEFDFTMLEDTPPQPVREAPEQKRPPREKTPSPPPRERPALQLPSRQELELEEVTPAPTPPFAGPTAPSDPAEPPQAGPSWQVFWEPFRTELSAQGFAQRLRETTGLEIKVDKRSANQYLVLFPYTSEEERQHHIELIEDRTSLKLKLSGQP